MDGNTLDFRRVMQQQINQKAKPLAKKFGLKTARENTFILEQDHIFYILSFGFIHSFELSSVFNIIPAYVAIQGDYFDALPFSEERMMRQYPVRPANREHRTTFLTEEARDKAVRAFDERLAYLENTLRYCNEIDTFEKFMDQVYKKMREKPRGCDLQGIPLGMDTYTYYALGVYDGMQKKYDEAKEKLQNALDEVIRVSPKDVDEARGKDVEEMKNNEIPIIHCKFILMFLEAINTNVLEREEQYAKTLERVCSRMRKYYGIKDGRQQGNYSIRKK